MGKYANNCVKMLVNYQGHNLPGRADVFNFCQEGFKAAPLFIQLFTITSNFAHQEGIPKGAPKHVDTMPDGHIGGPYPKYHRKADNMTFFYGTDPTNSNDLGAHVEFHVGEGKDEEVFEFDEPRCVFIPKGVRHGPLYVTKFRRNFIIVDVHTAPSREACGNDYDWNYIADEKKLEEVKRGQSLH
jgi:hypothetical protein